jgi:peptidoglycan hydrolase-like protein with peptidoglycan-binding domain
VAAILRHIGRGAEFCAGHKEYALPGGRKNDPSFDMEAFRSSVAAILSGTTPALALIPSAEPARIPGGPPGRPTLKRGATGELVKQVQMKVGSVVNGIFGPKTEAAVRAFQRNHRLVPDGIVGPKSWAELDTIT